MFIFNYLASKIGAIIFIGILSSLSFAQAPNAGLRGQILDEQNSIIIGASVQAIAANGKSITVVTNEQGEFVFNSLLPGKFTIRATQAGFAVYEKAGVEVSAGSRETLKITLGVEIEEQIVTVASETPVSTESDNNGGAIILKGDEAIAGFPDDSEDLEAALRALAGPSEGPNGGEILIDGIAGRLPPKSSIREIRINSNPFSAEFDRIGFGRIEILTKPGTNAFHGQMSFNFNDGSMNSRNPFASNRANYQSRQYGGNSSGPITPKSSFFVDFENRSIDDLAIVNAKILDSNFNVISVNESLKTPLTRTSLSPRFDYQISDTNTLTARYGFTRTANQNSGAGGFSLSSRGYNTAASEHSFQLTETAVINKSIISETRFQFLTRSSKNSGGDTTSPSIQVIDAFTSGGNGVGDSSSKSTRWEISNMTSWTFGNHSLKAGARLRGIAIEDVTLNNFAGTFTFTSLDQYRNVLQGLNGAAPTQFSIASGESKAKINQIDFSPFVQDDWKVRPNLTVNLGLRYEAQTNVSNNMNFAPRLGFAWSPDSTNGNGGQTVIRGGFGVFFDRIGESLSLTANRFNGSSLRSFIVTDPALLAQFPNAPSIGTLLSFATTQNTYRLADSIRSPYNMQTNIGIERQLPLKFAIAVNYVNTRGFNQLLSRNINAPIGYIFGDNTSGTRPLGNIGNVFQYGSTGRSAQNQLMISVRNNLSRNFSLYGMYVLGKSEGDTDGTGSFPANSYDLSGEYSRSSLDTRHRFIVGGNVKVPFGFSLNPFVIISSGTPFNITTGLDTNGDTRFTERPTYAQLGTRCNALGMTAAFCDITGVSDVNATIGRNYGTGNGFATVNLRLSRTFGFGSESAGGNLGSGSMGGGMGGGPMGGGGAGATTKKYNLMFSLQTQNLLNTTNTGAFIGNMSSSLFGKANSLAGGFGFGPGGGGGSAAYNRRIEAQIRFSF